MRAAIEELISANRTLRNQLLVNERTLTQALTLLNGGAGIGEVLMTVPSLHQRRASEDAVRALYDARHKVREIVIPSAVAEGLSLADITTAFGIPLEEVVGYANESLIER